MLPADGGPDSTPEGPLMFMTAVNVVIVVALCVELCVLMTRTDSDGG